MQRNFYKKHLTFDSDIEFLYKIKLYSVSGNVIMALHRLSSQKADRAG